MNCIFKNRGLIVSCQALENEPLHGGDTMVKMALAAQQSGAVGIRANGAPDIWGIKQAVELPVIGIIKRMMPGSDVFITPTLTEVKQIIEAGADIVALDVTDRENRLEMVKELIDAAHEAGVAVMADVSTFEEGMAAEKLGVDYVGTTLSGYTSHSAQIAGPDIRLLSQLAKSLTQAVLIAEGKISTPADAALALAVGAEYVVVGSAITRPQLITEQYVHAMSVVLG
ncbi:putative N-acetylmannosamine-6-phosphate 2-epimerase [Paenibacillus sp. J23TS9]|uniref:N-acetylmannosamine-6-phosphate 2-epimerase n=1 Tax=Paenibacillus sp. J23TS9 TaxID=2807193 RepID=UPI001B2A1A24|nr:N-acetylmannosamine-6-phosphate 2-epimerase [Paenibacillus sp. J23TS9]GIP28515.1 putative N-acetylmannosamine-6-phosphate 2-epimerase [Paenibacillus sp. J23TS9]